MTQPNKKDDVATPNLIAVINNSRVIEEKITAVENAALKDKVSGIRTYSNTGSTFEFGIPSEGEITSFQIELAYTVTVHLSEDHSELFKYESKSEVIFQLKSKYDSENLEDVPHEALAPYFSFVHFLARQRAAEHLLAAGIRGINLPIPDSIQPTPLDSPAPPKAMTAQEKKPAARTRQPKMPAPKAG